MLALLLAMARMELSAPSWNVHMEKILLWVLVLLDIPFYYVVGGMCAPLIAPALLGAVMVCFKWRCSAFTMIGTSDEPICSPTP